MLPVPRASKASIPVLLNPYHSMSYCRIMFHFAMVFVHNKQDLGFWILVPGPGIMIMIRVRTQESLSENPFQGTDLPHIMIEAKASPSGRLRLSPGRGPT